VETTVRIHRPAAQPGVLLMHGTTASYETDPDGQYFIGRTSRAGFVARRGARRWTAPPGALLAWDPSQRHSGSAARPWHARLLVLELPSVRAILDDPEHLPRDLELADPLVGDRALARQFDAVFGALLRPDARLEADTLLAEWLAGLAGRSPVLPRRRAARRDPAFRAACAYLGDNLARNVSLDELAAAAGVSRFRLVRLFGAAVGLPPHRFLLAQRINAVRALLERGTPIGRAALLCGFADQSHLYRHFRRAWGITPGEYLARLAPMER
jgi:AraC-like DNA-binding protein